MRIALVVLLLWLILPAQARLPRSQTARRHFLHACGFARIPPGYQVDHIRPLAWGGADAPENMQLLSIDEHFIKTWQERYIGHKRQPPTANRQLPTVRSL